MPGAPCSLLYRLHVPPAALQPFSQVMMEAVQSTAWSCQKPRHVLAEAVQSLACACKMLKETTTDGVPFGPRGSLKQAEPENACLGGRSGFACCFAL